GCGRIWPAAEAVQFRKPTQPERHNRPALCRSCKLGRYAIRFSISPIFSIQSFTTSPALRKVPLSAPVPDGVPVRIRSPGWSVILIDNCSICSASENSILPVLESCFSSPLTHSLRFRFCGSPISLAGTIHGPIGHEPSNDLCLVQSILNGEVAGTGGRRPRSRADRSLETM